MIGPDKAFDTNRFFVVSTNLLGGCRGTTGPSSTNHATGRPYGSDFPVITVADMVRTERAFLDELGIARLAAVAGGSLGGMQALEWAILYPDRVDCHRRDCQHARAAAPGHCVERDCAKRDYRRSGLAGRPLLRHRTRAERRHGRGADGWTHHLPVRHVREGASSGGGCSLPTISATTSRSPSFRSRTTCVIRQTSFVKRFDANTYLYTSRALTYFDLARQYGSGALEDALKDVRARTLLIGFSSDWLYPPSGSEELAAALRAAGKRVELHVIDAPYGHDCFLLEEARQTPMIQEFLAR